MPSKLKDSELGCVHFDGTLVHLILNEVKNNVLPDEEIQVPEWELPPADQDGDHVGDSIREREDKWTELRTTSEMKGFPSASLMR